ncbi:MAG: ATP-binding cassette domain-containing protein [Chlamydiae bacterium]|nr:ATP-binding cassette domain-containing protein [Chlamydiota bacterium]
MMKIFFKRKRIKTPTIIQMEVAECGSTALAIILAFYKKFIPLEELREICGVTRDGSSAFQLIKAARTLKLKTDGYKREINELYDLKFPFIAYWQFNHFVVVEGYIGKSFYINDPSLGPRKVSFDEFNQSFTGITIELEPEEGFEKSKKIDTFTNSVKERLGSSKKELLFLLITSFTLIFPGLGFAVFVQFFFDKVIAFDLNKTIYFSSLFVLLGISSLLSWMQLNILAKLNTKLSIEWSTNSIWHVFKLPIRFFLNRYSGEIANRLYNNDFVAFTLTGQLIATFANLLFVIFYLFLIIQINLTIGLIAIGAALINLSLLKSINNSRTNAFYRFQKDFGNTIGITVSGLRDIDTLKSSCSETPYYSRWLGYFTKTLADVQEINLKDVFLTAAPPIVQMLTTAFYITIATNMILNERISIGSFLALQILLMNFLTPLSQFINFGQMVQEIKSQFSRIDDLLKNKIDPCYLSTCCDTSSKLDGYVDINNISFGYNPFVSPTIENISLSAQPGQSVAICGSTGSGKTTLLNLIKGLYTPQAGEILFDKKKLSDLDRKKFVRSFACVDQNIFIFEGTFKDNITLWDETFLDEDLIKAAKDACIHEEIIINNLGYNHRLLEEGRNLSGGQRQRIEIARALIKNPTILLLDEATSSVDSDTEKQIISNIKRRGCSCIMVAHRLSTIKDCDEIIVLDDGKVIERGSHNELKEKKGRYYHLVQAQEIHAN